MLSTQVILSEDQLKTAALALGARSVPGWSQAESALVKGIDRIPEGAGDTFADQIRAGGDPLGDLFCRLRSPEERRSMGATYTPSFVVEAMIDWVAVQKIAPTRIVDPGVGSARFLLAAGKRFPKAELIGIEVDPLAALIARANLAITGFATRSQILVGDYRKVALPTTCGLTCFVGNPPYVRHHQLDSEGKAWLSSEARKLGHIASQLAGLHVHFFLATALKAKHGDSGIFVTSAEWLDVNYGRLVRDLFLDQLGGQGITVLDPASRIFDDAATTTAVTQFSVGSRPAKIRVARLPALDKFHALTAGQMISRNRFETENRWTHLTRRARVVPQDYVELGELCRVHRGTVTGANKVWIAGPHSPDLPNSVLYSSVTRARELFAAGEALTCTYPLRKVIDIPTELSSLDVGDRKLVDEFLRLAESAGARDAYTAKNRRAWWSVGLKNPAPILSTYMARRPPAFVRNLANARHINIAHGLYPRTSLSNRVLDNLVRFLSKSVSLSDGRTYAGGLTKFEPREMERLLVPTPDVLETLPA